jgi:hypothetical protein
MWTRTGAVAGPVPEENVLGMKMAVSIGVLLTVLYVTLTRSYLAWSSASTIFPFSRSMMVRYCECDGKSVR